MKSALRHLDEELQALARVGLLRQDPLRASADNLEVCSNDYLGFAAGPWTVAAVEGPGGAGASRLITGEHPAHRLAERRLAAWVGGEDALLFSSGYAANVGAIAALAGDGDVIVSDALNHASIIDGCRLSRARIAVVPHNDPAAAEAALRAAGGARRRWMVTESYFSMEGDIAELAALRRACDATDSALLVDEAHALGVFGPGGSGLCALAGVRADVLIGTLGKAVGLQGAFVAGSRALRSWLWNKARSFVFSTGVAPCLALAVAARIDRVIAADDRRSRLLAVATRLREGLAGHGVRLGHSTGPILPWVVGAPDRAVAVARSLAERGILVQAIRPPTVPAGTSRLRITARATLGEAEIDRVLQALATVSRETAAGTFT